jgi:hypothetical protein
VEDILMTAYPIAMQVEEFIKINFDNNENNMANNICECAVTPEDIAVEDAPETITGNVSLGYKQLSYRGIRQDQDGFVSKADDTYINYLVEVI